MRSWSAVLACLAFLAAALQAAEPGDGVQVIPPRDLRGFGKLSGTFTRLAGGASHLEVSCESDDKAKIVHAKYANGRRATS